MKERQKADHRGAQTIIGKLTGKRITIPDVNLPPMPALAPPGVIHIGIPILGINAVTFWFALRENGFEGAVAGAGRLLQEF